MTRSSSSLHPAPVANPGKDVNMDNEREASISFRQSILSMIPRTQSNRYALKQIRSMRNEDAVAREERRVHEIQSLLQSGRHDAALRQLLADTDSDLHYFNRLKHRLEYGDGDASATDEQEMPTLPDIAANDTLDDNEKDDGQKISMMRATGSKCQWLGKDNHGQKYCCANSCIVHPWKIYSNVYGDEEPLQLDFCSFHSRYCIDPNLRHPDDLVEIQNPNKFALCNGCYVQSKRCRPPTDVRIPGRRILRDDGHGSTTRAMPSSVKVEETKPPRKQKQPRSVSWRDIDYRYTHYEPKRRMGTMRATAHLLSEAIRVQRPRMRQSLMVKSYSLKRTFASNQNAATIQSAWRRYLAGGVAQHKRDEIVLRKRAEAAAKIQSYFRRVQQRKTILASIHLISYVVIFLCRVSRGFIARKRTRMIRCANIIKRAWKMYCGKVAVAAKLRCEGYVCDLTRNISAVILQRWARGCLREIRWQRYTSVVNKACDFIHMSAPYEECKEQDIEGTNCDASGTCVEEPPLYSSDESCTTGGSSFKDDSTCSSVNDESIVETISDKELAHTVSNEPGPECPETKLSTSRKRFDERIFERYDPYKKKSLSRHSFGQALNEMWSSNGEILLEPELKVIMDVCDRYGTGYVNTAEFIRFAEKQRAPCQAHARLVCAQCTIFGEAIERGSGCKSFVPCAESKNMCKCGRYRGAHEIMPKPLEPRTISSGRGIISQKEMAQVFKQRRAPDLFLPNGVKVVRLHGRSKA